MKPKLIKICILILIALGVSYVMLFSFFGFDKLKINSCFLKSLTGIPCVTCGTTRAFSLLLKGEIYESILLNPIALLVFIASISFLFLLVYDFFIGTNILNNLIEKTKLLQMNNRIIIILFLLLILNWIWNIIKMN